MITFLVGIVFSLIFLFREKSNIYSAIYLSLLPFVIFSGQSPFLLLLSLLMGCLLFILFENPSLSKFALFFVVFIVSIFVVKPRLGLDMGLLNSINAQRGEHPGFESGLLPKLIHNKAELVHSFISNFDLLLSPVAIFASGFWHKTSSYYPLGFLFPWDSYFIYRYFRNRKFSFEFKHWLYFIFAILTLSIISGLVYIDEAVVFSFAVIYFLALLSATGFAKSSRKSKLILLAINAIYLLSLIHI